ncbi:AraC family transcriptional regulator [Hoeflea sp.]|uniref:AraC family transcriptional regulator n=1 Tax=Hoeflea sp. TaxID=1940281 RepID=UPI003B02AB40
MVQPTVSAGLVSGLMAFAARNGADPATLAERADIDPGALDDPDGRLPLQCYVDLMRAARSQTADPALALHFAEQVGMSKVSIVGLIMEASATMGEAFLQLQRYGRLAAEVGNVADGPRFELVTRQGRLFMVDRRRNPNAVPELTESAFVSLVCGPRRFLPQPHVLSVYVTHPRPAYSAEYDRIFRCPVHFGTEWNAMELHPQIAEWEVAQNPRYVFGLLTGHADRLLRDLDSTKTLKGRVEALLLPLLHRGAVSADTVAAQLGFSRQTLFRRLKDEGTSYSQVHDELRQRIARLYLEGQAASVNETAYLVGFSEPASFSRAFKRWTGQSPKTYRQIHGNKVPGDPATPRRNEV